VVVFLAFRYVALALALALGVVALLTSLIIRRSEHEIYLMPLLSATEVREKHVLKPIITFTFERLAEQVVHSATCRQRSVLVPRDTVVATQNDDVTFAVSQRREVRYLHDHRPGQVIIIIIIIIIIIT